MYVQSGLVRESDPFQVVPQRKFNMENEGVGKDEEPEGDTEANRDEQQQGVAAVSAVRMLCRGSRGHQEEEEPCGAAQPPPSDAPTHSRAERGDLPPAAPHSPDSSSWGGTDHTPVGQRARMQSGTEKPR